MTEPDASWADRIVAEFGDGHPVEMIAARYGLTVPQVYAVVEGEVGAAGQVQPGHHPPPASYYPPPGHAPPAYYPPPGYPAPPPGQAYYPPPGHPGQAYYPPPAYPQQPAPPPATAPYPAPPAFPHEDAIVAEYADGHDVTAIAYRYGLTADQVYAVVQRALQEDPPPTATAG
ncbi:uncharacterized protein (DUF433 family) [Actinoplanes octamycinicus]|uniref:Uncharacterized protein (DUF433 family) n=1 Tax=Actinoplanes octamycinicus TaxID=135948 RepID=A0A7W7H7S5_9ACTN|nr:helix-turn-helix domain-containing protein [Actinoplanes octamycinicus]MBB4745407.1 uncharacterized protein (DUF433 family) [Actinoplanes octamycinicus]